MPQNNKTHHTMNIYNVIILDESGSMSSIYDATIRSMNEVLGGIRRDQEEHPEQHHYVTIVTFEGHGISGIKMRRDRVPIESVGDFTERDYRPGGCTPLYDAIGKTLNGIECLVREDDRVMATVITDGFENSSAEYSGRTVKNMVDRLRGKGWVLAYIGANQDAIEVARDLHIDNALNYDATPTGTAVMACKIKKAHRKVSAVFSIMGTDALKAYDALFDDEEEKK